MSPQKYVRDAVEDMYREMELEPPQRPQSNGTGAQSHNFQWRAPHRSSLSVWSNQPVSVDRKGQDAPIIGVLRPFVSVIGSIQPDVLPELAANREDGMLERFLFTYPEPMNALWTEDEISEEAKADYQDLCDGLRNLSMDTDELGDPVEKAITFSPEAKEVYIKVYDEHRQEMGASGFPNHLRASWAKLEAYLLRLILICAACRFAEEGGPEQVRPTDVWRAVLLMDYFKAQALRVFGALRGFDERLALMRDVAEFVDKQRGLWTGTATELHNQLPSMFKPDRPQELSRVIRQGWQEELGLLWEENEDSYKTEDGWRKRRELTLYLKNRATERPSDCATEEGE
jgi:hypothetical protein